MENVFRITIKAGGDRGQTCLYCHFPDFSSVQDVFAALIERGMVYGQTIRWDDTPYGRHVHKLTPIVIGRDVIHTVQAYFGPVIEGLPQ